MKKYLCLLLSTCMILMSGCAKSPDTGGTDIPKPEAEPTTETVTESAAKPLDDEVTVFDTEDYALKIKSTDVSNITEPTLYAQCTNKSKDMYIFYMESSFIDGVEAPTLWMYESEAGTDEETPIGFFMDEFEKLGVKEITDFEMTISVYEESLDNPPLDQQTIHIFPNGAENAKVYEHETAEGEQVICDTPEAKATVIECGMDELGEYSVWLWLENKTDSEIMFTSSDEYLNGRKAADPSFSWAVGAHRSAYTRITWYADELSSMNITDVDEVSLELHVFDSTDLEKPDYFKQEVTILP